MDRRSVAHWRGDIKDYEIMVYDGTTVGLLAGDNLADEEVECDEVSMTRNDLMAVIAGLQNALAEMDSEQ